MRAAARNLLTNIVEASDEYALSKAVLRYLIQFYRNENDHIQALGFAKNLYVKAAPYLKSLIFSFNSSISLSFVQLLQGLSYIQPTTDFEKSLA